MKDRVDNWSEKVKRVDTSFDWGAIRSVFKNERIYISKLIENISEEINNLPSDFKEIDVRTNLNIVLGHQIIENDQGSGLDSAIQYVYEAFLRTLEVKEILSDLKIEIQDLADGNDDLPPNPAIVAKFVIENAKTFTKRVSDYIDFYLKNKDTIDTLRSPKEITFYNNGVHWGKEKIFGSGLALVFTELHKKGAVYSKGKCQRPGVPISMKELRVCGGYKNNDSFRKAIEKIRECLGQKGLGSSLVIESSRDNDLVPTGHFCMVIKN